MGPVLVVAAHPDDDVLGCGATMARWAAEGRQVSAAFLTDGVGARGNGDHLAGAAARRRMAAQEAGAVLGVGELRFGEWPDNRLDSVALLELAQFVEGVVREIRPETVLTHHPHDLNVDHRLVSEAVATACRPQPGAGVRAIYSFEVASSTEWRLPSAASGFQPNVYVDVAEHLPAKLAALACYREELRGFPHSRSIEAVEALARWRGACVGVEAAEAFVLQRMVL